MAGKPAGAAGRLALKRKYERAASIEPFFTGGSLALSRDGNILACTCGGDVKLLDTKTGAVRATVAADGELVTALALSPNGQELMTAGRDFMVRTWEVALGKKVRTWKASQGNCYVQRLAYDETSTLAAGGCSDGVVRVWDAGRGFATHSLRGHSSLITSVCFGATPRTDPNKLLLFSGADDGEVRVWALATKSCKAVLKNHDSAVTAILLHVPTRSLITGARDRVVNVWDLKQMKISSSVPIYDTIEGLAIVPPRPKGVEIKAAETKSSKKKRRESDVSIVEDQAGDGAPPEPVTNVADIEFVTAGVKGVLKRWKVGGGSCVLSEPQRGTEVSYAGLLMDESTSQLLATTIDQTLQFVDPTTLQTTKQMVGHNDEIVDTAFASEELIAVCTNTDHLRIFNITTQSCSLLHGHTDIILGVDCSPAGGVMVTASKDRTLRLWHRDTGRCVGVAEGHIEAVGAVAIAPRSHTFVVSGSKDLTVKIWDLKKMLSKVSEADVAAKLPVLRTWKAHDKDINSVAISPNDALIATGSADRTVKFWDASTGMAMGVCKGHKRGVWCVKFSPVDKIVASSSADATLKLWSLSDSSCVKTFEGHEGSVLKCAFVCSGMQLLSAGSDGLLKLWTIKSSECVGSFDHHTDKVWALAVAPGDDTLVVSGGADSVITLWDDKTSELDEEAFQKSQEKILLEQDMANALRAKDYRKAVMLAFELKQPFRLLQVIDELIAQGEEGAVLDTIISRFTDEQLSMCVGYVRDWNTTSRNSHAAQVMLNGILRTFRLSKLAALPDVKTAVEALVPYTERHFQRVEDAIQRTYYIDFVLHSASAVGDEGEANGLRNFVPLRFDIDVAGDLKGKIGTVNKSRVEEGEDDDEENDEDVNDSEGDESQGEAGENLDGDVDMAGWGSWGGDQEADDGSAEQEGVQEEEEDEAKPPKSKGKSRESVQPKSKGSATKPSRKQESPADEDEDSDSPRTNGKKTASAVKPKGKKSAVQPSQGDATPRATKHQAKPVTPPPAKAAVAQTTGKKKKLSAGKDVGDAKRRKSMDDTSNAKSTPPVAKRLRSKA